MVLSISGCNRIDNDLFLSKAFSNSMHPSKIIPFFYRASANVESDDVTITTLITSNRFPVFARLVEDYRGPISVAIHVTSNNSSEYHALLDSIHALYTSSLNMARYVDVHLVMDSFDRQFNTWRNIARLFARSDFVMMLDVDFAICTDFRSAIRGSKAVLDSLREGNSAFVIPAFEFMDHEAGSSRRRAEFPSDKLSLLSAVKVGRLAMFHASWEVGHNSTDYPRYYAAPPGQVYKVTKYQSAYEPYVILKKDGPPWCDERFVGYGGNKAACLFEMYLSGISFYVLSDHFIIHQNHLYEEKARKDERRFNKKIYAEFKEETCLRYFKHYHDLGILNTTRGYNIQTECIKLKGFPRIAQQILQG
ncbi:glycosyl-transferase for dystroglycan-domain-containing protein [Rhodocollybia butyracea]|uniref:Glycosyl-transferase for dystroglycan-domain-containing protein n=1 Tax=Rhodocollybia butyracea TaxID=206335 RepID=A0A9P5PW40_9AGAR|nr:glycosyl-transferase for dystroglycan-domain-containing protein [Rhodocollybia butyracea]